MLDTPQVFSYLTRVMYNRRNKFDPLWNSLVVAGYEGGKPFLGQVSGAEEGWWGRRGAGGGRL